MSLQQLNRKLNYTTITTSSPTDLDGKRPALTHIETVKEIMPQLHVLHC